MCVCGLFLKLNSRHYGMLGASGVETGCVQMIIQPHHCMEQKGPSIRLCCRCSGTMTWVGLTSSVEHQASRCKLKLWFVTLYAVLLVQRCAGLTSALETCERVQTNPSVLMVLMCLRSLRLKASVIKWTLLCVVRAGAYIPHHVLYMDTLIQLVLTYRKESLKTWVFLLTGSGWCILI